MRPDRHIVGMPSRICSLLHPSPNPSTEPRFHRGYLCVCTAHGTTRSILFPCCPGQHPNSLYGQEPTECYDCARRLTGPPDSVSMQAPNCPPGKTAPSSIGWDDSGGSSGPIPKRRCPRELPLKRLAECWFVSRKTSPSRFAHGAVWTTVDGVA